MYMYMYMYMYVYVCINKHRHKLTKKSPSSLASPGVEYVTQIARASEEDIAANRAARKVPIETPLEIWCTDVRRPGYDETGVVEKNTRYMGKSDRKLWLKIHRVVEKKH